MVQPIEILPDLVKFNRYKKIIGKIKNIKENKFNLLKKKLLGNIK